MSIELHTVDNGNVQAINDGRLYGEFTGNVGGIVNGSVVTSAGGLALHVTSGWGIGYGRVFTITADDYTVQPASSGTQKGRLYVHIDISQPDNPIDIRSVAAASLPALVQENLSEGGAIYEIELAHYDVTALAVSNLVSNTKVKFLGHAGDSDKLGGVVASGYLPKSKIRTGTVSFMSDATSSINVTFDTPLESSSYFVAMTTSGGNTAYAFVFTVFDKVSTGFKFLVRNIGTGSPASREATYIAILV